MTLNNKPMASFRACWKAGVPLMSIDSIDPAATIRNCIASLNGKGNTIPLCEWDLVSGLRGTNIPGQPMELGASAAQTIAEGTPGPEMLTNPVETLAMIARKAPDETIVFCHGIHRLINDTPVAQAIWNCRDSLKPRHVTLVLLGPSIKLPAELSQDVVGLSEQLPSREEISQIIDSVFKDAGLKPEILSDEQRKRAIDSMRGLSAFASENVLSACVTKEGIDQEALWDKKVKLIESTPGLTVYRGKERLNDVGGLENAKTIGTKTMRGKLGITCIVLIDEMDKGFSAANTDTSGTTQDQNKVLLSYMQDKKQIGKLWLGPPGTGKTLLAKALANEFGVPLIMLDLGAMKGSLVGQSEQQMRAAIAIIDAISDGKALWIGACNKSDNLPPELRRRFNYSAIFFDLPDASERAAAWKVHQAAYNLTADQCDTVNDQGWTGAEIHNACLKAWAMDCKLSDAASTIVPVSISAADIVDGLRKASSGKYISASQPGIYRYTATAQQTSRKITVKE